MSDNKRPTLTVGLRHHEQMVVADRHTVPRVALDWSGFRDMPPVFATAMMIGFIEQTCIEALRPYLSPEQRTVGTHVDVSHVAATPVGGTVTANVELIEAEGRILLFRVACHDDAGLIGEGLHRRAIIDLDRFMHRLASKAGTGP
jgi:fluoroacetyl-CoA thioesterase